MRHVPLFESNTPPVECASHVQRSHPSHVEWKSPQILPKKCSSNFDWLICGTSFKTSSVSSIADDTRTSLISSVSHFEFCSCGTNSITSLLGSELHLRDFNRFLHNLTCWRVPLAWSLERRNSPTPCNGHVYNLVSCVLFQTLLNDDVRDFDTMFSNLRNENIDESLNNVFRKFVFQ